MAGAGEANGAMAGPGPGAPAAAGRRPAWYEFVLGTRSLEAHLAALPPGSAAAAGLAEGFLEVALGPAAAARHGSAEQAWPPAAALRLEPAASAGEGRPVGADGRVASGLGR